MMIQHYALAAVLYLRVPLQRRVQLRGQVGVEGIVQSPRRSAACRWPGAVTPRMVVRKS
jgi:hypothetical protein